MDAHEAERAQACLDDIQAFLKQAAADVAGAQAQTDAARHAAIEQAIASLRAADVPVPTDLAQEQKRLTDGLQGVVRSRLFLEAFRRLAQTPPEQLPVNESPVPTPQPVPAPSAPPATKRSAAQKRPAAEKPKPDTPATMPTDLTARELVPYALDQLGEYATTDRLLSYIQAFYPEIELADIADVVPQRLAG